jgi:hypothetical protein
MRTLRSTIETDNANSARANAPATLGDDALVSAMRRGASGVKQYFSRPGRNGD